VLGIRSLSQSKTDSLSSNKKERLGADNKIDQSRGLKSAKKTLHFLACREDPRKVPNELTALTTSPSLQVARVNLCASHQSTTWCAIFHPKDSLLLWILLILVLKQLLSRRTWQEMRGLLVGTNSWLEPALEDARDCPDHTFSMDQIKQKLEIVWKEVNSIWRRLLGKQLWIFHSSQGALFPYKVN